MQLIPVPEGEPGRSIAKQAEQPIPNACRAGGKKGAVCAWKLNAVLNCQDGVVTGNPDISPMSHYHRWEQSMVRDHLHRDPVRVKFEAFHQSWRGMEKIRETIATSYGSKWYQLHNGFRSLHLLLRQTATIASNMLHVQKVGIMKSQDNGIIADFKSPVILWKHPKGDPMAIVCCCLFLKGS